MQLFDVCLKPIEALRIDDFALAVDHVIVLDHALANIKVVTFDADLRLLDGLADHAVFDRFVFREAGGFHQALHIVVGEALHEFIVEAEEKTGLAGVALTAGATSQLIVNAARLVAFGAKHEQAPRRPVPPGDRARQAFRHRPALSSIGHRWLR